MKMLSREDVDRILNKGSNKRCATQLEIKMIQEASFEKARKKGVELIDLNQSDMDEILTQLGIPDVELISRNK